MLSLTIATIQTQLKQCLIAGELSDLESEPIEPTTGDAAPSSDEPTNVEPDALKGAVWWKSCSR